LGELGIDGKVILKFIFKKLCMRLWTAFTRIRTEFTADCCGYLVPIKYKEFLD
jgi:hypothetical protein